MAQFNLPVISCAAGYFLLPAEASVVAVSKSAATADTIVTATSGVTTSNGLRVFFDGASGITKGAIAINGATVLVLSSVATAQAGSWMMNGVAGNCYTFIAQNGRYISSFSFRATAAVGNVWTEFFSV